MSYRFCCLNRVIRIATCAIVTMALSSFAIADKPLVMKSGNTLLITGDADSNNVTLIGAGLNSVGVFVGDVPWLYNEVAHLTIDMGGGDDRVIIDQLEIAGLVSIDVGDGDNQVEIGVRPFGQNCLYGDTLIRSGDGADLIAINNMCIEADLDIDAGDGENFIYFGYPKAGVPSKTTLTAHLTIDTGAHNDRLYFLHCMTLGEMTIRTSAGDDTLKFGAESIQLPQTMAHAVLANAIQLQPKSLPSKHRKRSLSRRNKKPSKRDRNEHVNWFSELTIDTGADLDLVRMNQVWAGPTSIQLMGAADTLQLTSHNVFPAGQFIAQGGLGQDDLVDTPTDMNTFASPPIFLSFEDS